MSICKILRKKLKCLHKGPKMVDLDIFRVKLENNVVISEMIILKFVKLQSFSEKKKCLYLRSTMPFSGIFDQKCLV